MAETKKGVQIVIIALGVAASIYGVSVKDDQPVRKFLKVTKLDTSVARYGRHIEVKQVLPVRTKGLISNNLDDRDLISRSSYTRDEDKGRERFFKKSFYTCQ